MTNYLKSFFNSLVGRKVLDTHLRLSTLCLCLLVCSSVYPANPSDIIDFEAGASAYQNKEYSRAIEIFSPLALQGHPKAQSLVAYMLQNGIGVQKNLKEAAKWASRAADQGEPSSQLGLGMLYLKGVGVPRDYQQAYFWLLLAGSNDMVSASKLIDYLEMELTPAERSKIQAATRKWTPRIEQLKNNQLQAPGIKSPINSNPDSSGSGFRVAAGMVITNHHVVDQCVLLRVNGDDAVLQAVDIRSDLALIKVAILGPVVFVRSSTQKLGEAITVAGYPLRGFLSGINVTSGNITSLSGPGGDSRLVQISAPVQPGNSGGPMLDVSGTLLGVVVSKLDALKIAEKIGDIPQNINFAINALVLRSFLDSNGVDYLMSTDGTTLSPAAVAEKAKTFTVLIECFK